MLIFKFAFFGCILSILHRTSVSQFTDSRLCDTKCVCIGAEKLVACSEGDKMGGLPTNVELSVHKLIVQKGDFHNPVLYRRNLTNLGHLRYLKVIYCKLTGVEERAFEDMKYLTYLDLSHNALHIIQPFTFSGLRLQELHLMENPGVKLVSNSFKELSVDSINLRSNELKTLDYEIFENIDLKSLFLYNNRLSQLDQRFSEIFKQPDAFIDMTGNPIDCNCEMKWIIPILSKKLGYPETSQKYKSISFKCSSPLSLAGRDMKDLSQEDMSCPPPKIKSVSVLFGIPFTQLTCVAVGNNFRAPGVAWNYLESDNVRELRRIPLTQRSRNQERLESSLSVNVTTSSTDLKAFTCTTWLDHSSKNENIVVNIKAPPINTLLRQPKPFVTSRPVEQNVTKNVDLHPNLAESNFVYKKQFTIIEMIIAVVSTFTATLILLMFLAVILRFCRRHHKPDIDYKAVNIIKPYWTLGNDSNTYSHPVSHADYDVPRIYDSRAPSICQSPPLNRVEFIDYKTQNKIYSS